MSAANSSEMTTAQIFSLRSDGPGFTWIVLFLFFMDIRSYSFSDFSKCICSMVRPAITRSRTMDAADPRP